MTPVGRLMLIRISDFAGTKIFRFEMKKTP